MVDNLIYQQTSELLEMLETEMERAALMAPEAPSQKAMNSTAPFACDAMPLEAWLQFIFLPRMRQILEHRQPLPSAIAITPMAEEAFREKTSVIEVIAVLRKIDALLSEQ